MATQRINTNSARTRYGNGDGDGYNKPTYLTTPTNEMHVSTYRVYEAPSEYAHRYNLGVVVFQLNVFEHLRSRSHVANSWCTLVMCLSVGALPVCLMRAVAWLS